MTNFTNFQMKCVKYWPFGKSAQFGDIFVTIENEEHHQHYVKRTMKASFVSFTRILFKTSFQINKCYNLLVYCIIDAV